MKIIDDETLALYAEGKLDNDKEALDAVRKYLCSHPERLEDMLYMMDDSTEDYLGEMNDFSKTTDAGASAFDDIFHSAVAFVPQNNMAKSGIDVDGLKRRKADFFERLDNLCDEVNKVK